MVVDKVYEHDDNLDHIKHENYTARFHSVVIVLSIELSNHYKDSIYRLTNYIRK
jgi:hypothetical protein